MTFDYKEMVKEAIKTSQPATRVRQLGCHDKTPASVSQMTLDTTARVAPLSRCHHSSQASLAQQTYTRTHLKRFIDKWPARDQANKAEDGIALAGKDSFSSAFTAALGMANTTNICGLDDVLIKAAVFEALLEREASCQFASGSNANLRALLNIKESHGRESMTVSGELGPDNELRWTLNLRTTGTTWARLLCMIFNLSRMDALATLANILSMSFDNLSKLSSDRHAVELKGGSRPIEDVPDSLHLPGLPAGSACAELMEIRYIYGNAGQIIGAILRYRLNGNDFCLPATVGRGVLCMGKYKPTAHFLNQHLMDQHPFAPVIFFQDMRTALAFERMLGETQGYDPEEFIITAHLGTDLSVLPWNYFHGHEVVFVPAPTKVCMAMVKLYRDYIMGAWAQDFRIYPGFLLHSKPSCDLKEHVTGVTDAEDELLRGAVRLDTVERPTWLMEQVAKKGFSYDDFVAWGQKLGIFKAPTIATHLGTTTQPHALAPANPALTPERAYNLADVNLYHILRPGSYAVLMGAKGAGKTQVALSASHSIIKGDIMWPLFRGVGINAGNVAYIDAETPHDEYCANLEQHGLTTETGHRFFGLSRFGDDLPEFCNTFSLTDAQFREGLFHYLLEHKCRFVFLDNLTALMGDAVHQGKAAQEVLDWVEKLQQCGLCVVLVHHKFEHEGGIAHSDKARGSQLFIIRARTVIALVSRTEILREAVESEKVRSAAADDGLTVGVRFNASKPAPVLEKRTFWLHLPLGASEWQFLAATGADGTEIPFLPPADEPAESMVSAYDASAASENAGEAEHCELSEEERKVYEYAKSHGEVGTKDAKTQLSYGDTRAREVLQALAEKGLLVHNNKNGRATAYLVNK
ncbi:MULTISPECIES: AAA family ATPase [unclassified Desulfovibrio]|uniref:AAA family ATPase n=1 Tax=unclassified Desulfovibrio TaxID=2593640 RepID=UPI002FDB282A